MHDFGVIVQIIVLNVRVGIHILVEVPHFPHGKLRPREISWLAQD